MTFIRSLLFNAYYWVISILFVLSLAPLSWLPSDKILRTAIVFYSRAMRFGMRVLAGIRFEYRGLEKLPKGPFIIAAKHQSWGDGFGAVSKFGDIAFVTGSHLEKFPFLGRILRKIGAIVVDNCGGHKARKNLNDSFANVAEDGRNVLIYPEGHLVKIGDRIRYRSGVFHLQEASGWDVVPMATNLGLFWSCEAFNKESGIAINEVLEPIPAGLPKEEFMARLEAALNEGSRKLCEEGQKEHPLLSQANIKWPDEINKVM
jgi:1-acyl-sn-glycerol-3-phosphate acyltransferase